MTNNKGNMEKELDRVLKEEPNIILDHFISEKLSVMSLLNVKISSPQQLMMALELILKACKSTSDPNLIAKFLCQLAACKDCLIIAISVLVAMELTTTKTPRDNFVETVVNLLHVLVQRIPTVSMDVLEIILPQLFEVWMKNSGSEHILCQLEKLEKQKETFIVMRQNIEKSSKPSASVPFDFRLLPNIPSIEEMSSGKPFFRPAIVNGPYSDVEQYLDIHFRLLREDMFHDFRKCLHDFHSHKTLENGRLYHNAYIDGVEQTNYGTLLYFAIPVRSKVDWKTTKRLVPGSLLCLSCDEFTTFYFGSIESRKDDGRDGNISYVTLSFEPTKEPQHFLNFYTIIETGGYYESCKYIFENFKTLTSSTFPFENCLLDYKSCDSAPFFLNSEQELQLRTFQSEINDDIQNQAFELALRSKISLIQGPPGTGKSYLGVQIARYLTQIADIKKPVVVMCYTNHALDQFLEKMLDFTNKIVRIGSRSKSLELKFHCLRSLTDKSNYDNIHNESFYKKFSSKSVDEEFPLESVDEEFPLESVDEEFPLKSPDKKFSRESFKIFCDVYGDRRKFIEQYPNQIHYKVKHGCETVSQSLSNGLNKIKYPFRKTTMDVRLCDIHGLHDVFTKGKLKGVIFNTVMRTADKIKLYQWLMMDKSFLDVYDDMADFRKVLTEELLGSFQLRNIRKKKKRIEGGKVEKLPELLIRLCIKSKSNSFFLRRSPSAKKVEEYVHDFLFSNELVFPLFLRAAIRCAEKNGIVVDEECYNLWLLDINERWHLLSILLTGVSTFNITEKLQEIDYYLEKAERRNRREKLADFKIRSHEKHCKELKDYHTDRNAHFLQGADIIGITTTGAAKNFDLLKKVGATTYIVEEAAEVFESSIVTSLIPDTKHLILIGDHFQLRPSPNVYTLAVKYKMDVSLFERLFKNGAPSTCLRVQYRMRPSISRLLVPDFYRSLDNHRSVLEYENVAGVSSNVFFLQHSELENEDDELQSHSNSYEAFLIVSLCEYLISQGNDPCSITMLTTYVGQLHLIRKNMQGGRVAGALATTVDNYQGEENDIILISFVRSNVDNTVGFIKTHNRLCVALSRARKGLYCIGNFNMLASQSRIWQSLLIKLEEMGSFGEKLAINCCRHPEIKSLVGTPFDFEHHMMKGCHEPCNKMMHCGHICVLPCHEGTEHSGNQCNTKCKQAILEECSSLYEEVETDDDLNDTKEISEEMDITPRSENRITEGHSNMPSKKTDDISAQNNSTEIRDLNKLDHDQKKDTENGSQTDRNEVIKSDKDLISKVVDDILVQNASKDALELVKSDANKEYTKILSCGHKMVLKSGLWRFRNYILESKCREMVVSQMKCGESVKHTCGEKAGHHNCSSPSFLKCGHTAPCDTDPNSKLSIFRCVVEVEVTLSCGHPYKIPCFKKDYLYGITCERKCGSLLPCHHMCTGICDDCSSSGKHEICRTLVKRSLSCGHILETECSTPFRICNQRCMFRCVHTRCINPCNVTCFPCKKPCTWNCEHYRCDKLCNEICDRPPCDEHCQKRNPSCGHPCSGFCGEPCPTFCQQCTQGAGANNEKVILLEDCGHCVPYTELSRILTKHEFHSYPKCPECNAPITKNVRFGNTLKSYYKSRNGKNPKPLVVDLPIIQFFQPYISNNAFEKHVQTLWDEFQTENLNKEDYILKLKVTRQLHVLFYMNEFQKHLFMEENDSITVLYESLRENKADNCDVEAEIFRIGASLFIREVTATENMFSKVGRVNEMCEDIETCFETSPFNNEMVEVVKEMVEAVNHLNCPILSEFIEFLEELQSAIA